MWLAEARRALGFQVPSLFHHSSVSWLHYAMPPLTPSPCSNCPVFPHLPKFTLWDGLQGEPYSVQPFRCARDTGPPEFTYLACLTCVLCSRETLATWGSC